VDISDLLLSEPTAKGALCLLIQMNRIDSSLLLLAIKGWSIQICNQHQVLVSTFRNSFVGNDFVYQEFVTTFSGVSLRILIGYGYHYSFLSA
jgi:hypothetical protein